MPEALIVVPCFDEAARFRAASFDALLDDDRMRLLFVDDGSSDGTGEVLRAFCASRVARASHLALPKNMGKGAAVRTGLATALGRGASIVGYLDADLATPPAEVSRMLDLMTSHGAEVTLASRVKLLGTEIRRDPARHYLGRIFATMASSVLGLSVYDTQCGAKLFRAGSQLAAALEEPFLSRWAFDVELLGRLAAGAPGVPGLPEQAFLEVPLREWSDVPGSKIRLSDMSRAALDLALIGAALRARRVRALDPAEP